MVIKNLLKYLRRTKDVFLFYGVRDLVVSGYTNASNMIEMTPNLNQAIYSH